METLGPYWLRRILFQVDSLVLYEAQDIRTGLCVFFLRNAAGTPFQVEGVVPVLEVLPEGWVLEWPQGAVPLSAYLGVADPERLLVWGREMGRLLALLKEKGVAYAPRPELVLVKGRRVWFVGVGAEALQGDGEAALRALLGALAGAREEVLGAIETLFAPWETPGQRREEDPEGSPAKPVVEVVEEAAAPSPPPEESPAPPSRPRVIRIEERDEPPFEPISPPAPRRRRWLLLALLSLLGGSFFLLRPRERAEGPYRVEFRTEPPDAVAELFLLEAPEGSKMAKGSALGRAPGWVAFDRKGVYRIRIRVAGRDPVDYLLEVPSPPVTIKLK